jgi:hypothetical protein
MGAMGAFLQIFNNEEMAVKGCGRACENMHPLTLPAIPASPPLSLLALIKANPGVVFEEEWLAAMDAGETIH